MQVTIYTDAAAMGKIRQWINYETKGHFHYPNNAIGVLLKEAAFIPGWMKKHILPSGYKNAGAYQCVEGQFYVGKHGEWFSVDSDGIIKMGRQFHEIQYYLRVIRDGGKVLGWQYHGDHPEHIKCPPWEIHVDYEDKIKYCESDPRNFVIDDEHKVIHIGCQNPCSTNKKDPLIL